MKNPVDFKNNIGRSIRRVPFPQLESLSKGYNIFTNNKFSLCKGLYENMKFRPTFWNWGSFLREKVSLTVAKSSKFSPIFPVLLNILEYFTKIDFIWKISFFKLLYYLFWVYLPSFKSFPWLVYKRYGLMLWTEKRLFP